MEKVEILNAINNQDLNRSLKLLRLAGVQEGQNTSIECNVSGERFDISEITVRKRGGVPVVVGRKYADDPDLSDPTDIDIEVWENQ